MALTCSANAQVTTVTLYPNVDAAIGYQGTSFANAGNNYGTATQFAGYDIPAAGGGTNRNRALINFDLSSIPSGATIQSAELDLYAFGPIGAYSGHTGTANSCWLQPITASWAENTVTWNNQPATTTTNQVSLAVSSFATQNYFNIDVTTIIANQYANPTSFYGVMLRLQTEATTNILAFASSDNANSDLHPALTITYCVPLEYEVPICQDAAIGFHDNLNTANTNYGTATHLAGYDIPGTWGGHNINRGLLAFDFSSLPNTTGMTLTGATLDLHAFGPISTYSGHTGTANSCLIQRVTSAWAENTVTWNTQPTTTTTNQVTLANSTSATQDYTGINVLPLVQDMLVNEDVCNGVMLRLANEALTNILIFCSSDHATTADHPRLVLTYTCNSPSPKTNVQLGDEAQTSTVYPNPSTGNISVSFEGMTEGSGHVELYDAQGRKVYQRNFKARLGQNILQLDLVEQGLEKGIYLMNVQAGTKTMTHKVILQ